MPVSPAACISVREEVCLGQALREVKVLTHQQVAVTDLYLKSGISQPAINTGQPVVKVAYPQDLTPGLFTRRRGSGCMPKLDPVCLYLRDVSHAVRGEAPLGGLVFK